MNEKVMVAMSGGVDSAVAAAKISKEYGAAGVTMRLFADNEKDIEGAAALCRTLGIPHFTADLGAAFRERVILPFINTYLEGKTPNPCVLCNRAIKFGALLDFARENGYDKLATGHYARVEKSGDRFLLRRAANTKKDQSYVLYTLSQETLSRVLFPLGDFAEKDEVREFAATHGFPMARAKESQDICFIPDGDYVAFIQKQTNIILQKGKFLDIEGNEIGEHDGMLHYTLGQRKGLRVGFGEPRYVVAKSAKQNTVTLGRNEDLMSSRVTAEKVNWIPFDALGTPRVFDAKIRYGQRIARARVEMTSPDTLVAEFETPQRAVAPGQSIVFYDGEYLVGGGVIT